MLIDTHCHLGFQTLFPRIDDVLLLAKENGVLKFITIGCEIPAWSQTIAIINKYSEVYGAIGLHPHEASKWNDEVKENLSRLLKSSRKIKALGEIGLDYFYLDKTKDLKEQENLEKFVFREQLELARQFKLPVIIHTRDAEADTLEMLKNFTDLKIVIHCFSGTKEFALKMVQLGFYISFTGIITFAKSDSLRDVLKTVPLNRIMIETDSPYLAPEPFRGKVNEPKYLRAIFEKVSVILGKNEQELEKILAENSKLFFEL